MHEMSIVRSIAKTLEMEFEPQKLARLRSIYLKVGALANVEPQLLHNAYEAHRHGSPVFRDVALHIEPTSIRLKCERCKRVSDVERYRFICYYCKTPSKNIVQGKELTIHKVEFE